MGPFQMAETWTLGQDVVLRSFPGFIQTPDLDGIRFVPFADAAASWLPFLNGSVDIAEVPAGQIELAEKTTGRADTSLPRRYYYGLNVSSRA